MDPTAGAAQVERRSYTSALIAAAGAACLVVPAVPPAAALAAGVLLAVTVGNPLGDLTRPLTRRLLPIAVVALGAGMDLRAVARAGARGVGYTVVSIAACLALGLAVTRAARVPRRTGVLITVGTAICGGSAIAAAAPAIGADEHETSVALGTVFLLNASALLLFPLLGHAAALSQPSFGLWAALAIHDTSSVVGATLHYGAEALQVGTTVKLARALWIAPVALGLGMLEARRSMAAVDRRLHVPWFILGFVAVAALVTFLPGLRGAGAMVARGGQRALVLTLFLIGLGLSRPALRAVGLRPLVLGVTLWAVMGAGTFAAIRAGLAHL